MTAPDVRAAVAAVRHDGRQRAARCPAHDDHRASLSVGRGDDGRVLLHCHAGCALDAILTAAGLTTADLFPNNSMTKPRIIAEYPYHDEHGRHLYDVVRFEPKDFRQRRADGVWSLKGVRRVLYRLNELRGQTTAYVVEGERDADRLRSIGLPGTTAVGGAGKWRDEYAQQLVSAGVRNVIVLPDHDDPGREHADDVARSCHAAELKVQIVTLPDLAPKGDVSDWLDAGHTRDELEALVQAAPLWTPTAWGDGQQIELVTLADVQPEPIEWIWPGRIAKRKYVLLSGDPGLGKSTVLLDLAARLSRGGTWPDGTPAPRGRTLMLSGEEGLADTLRPRLDRHGGDPSQIVVLRSVRDEHGARPLNLARDIERLAEAIRRVRPVLVTIDPITSYLGKTDSYKDAEVRGLLAPLLALVERENVALVAVGHLSKGDQRAALHRPGGSIAFVAAARIVLCLAADPADADRRVLAGLKSNLAPLPASLAFRLPEGRLEWEHGAVALDAETLLQSGPAPQDRGEQTDAERVIRDLLADHSQWPLDAREAIAAGQAHGISDRTMRRTARALGIRIRRLGFGAGGRWSWHQPIEAASGSPAPMAPMAPMSGHTGHRGHIDVIEDTHTCTDGDDRNVTHPGVF